MTWGENQASQTHSCPTLLRPQGCRLRCPWNSPSKNSGVGGHSLLQGSLRSRDRHWVSCIAGGSFTVWTTREPGPVHFLLPVNQTKAGVPGPQMGYATHKSTGPVLPSLFLPSIWHKLSTVSLSLGSCLQFCNLRHQEHMGSFIKIPAPRPVPTPIELEFQRKSPSSSGWLESRAESENHSR